MILKDLSRMLMLSYKPSYLYDFAFRDMKSSSATKNGILTFGVYCLHVIHTVVL